MLLLLLYHLHFRVMEFIEAALNLSQMFGLPASEPGIVVVEYVFSVVWQLLEASLDDEQLLDKNQQQKSRWGIKTRDMEIGGHDEKSNKYSKALQDSNTVMAIEIIGQLLQNKGTSKILYLARKQLYELVPFQSRNFLLCGFWFFNVVLN